MIKALEAVKSLLRNGSINTPLVCSSLFSIMAKQELAVKHIPEKFQFVIKMEGTDEEAHLDYEIIDDKKWDLQHTVVPVAFRGQGIAKVLAKAAFDHVVKENLTMKLTCWYLKGYAEKNPLPEYVDRIVD